VAEFLAHNRQSRQNFLILTVPDVDLIAKQSARFVALLHVLVADSIQGP
jgi:hypothetical protein